MESFLKRFRTREAVELRREMEELRRGVEELLWESLFIVSEKRKNGDKRDIERDIEKEQSWQ